MTDDRPDWMERANCIGVDPDLFFPTGRRYGAAVEVRRAVAICNECEVRLECLEYALANGEKHGVWGGKSVRERQRIARARRRAA
jgi:WhiB family redox-sensing transcriptional regulator